MLVEVDDNQPRVGKDSNRIIVNRINGQDYKRELNHTDYNPCYDPGDCE